MHPLVFKWIFVGLLHISLQLLCIFSANFKEKKKYENKEILIIGGTKGLGLSIALELSNYNNVTVAARKELDIEFLPIKYEKMDITKEICIDQKYDVFFLTAGYSKPKLFQNLTEEEIRDEFEVNYFGPIRVIHKIVAMQQRSPNDRDSMQENMPKKTDDPKNPTECHTQTDIELDKTQKCTRNEKSVTSNSISKFDSKNGKRFNSYDSERVVAPDMSPSEKGKISDKCSMMDSKEIRNGNNTEEIIQDSIEPCREQISMEKQPRTDDDLYNIKVSNQNLKAQKSKSGKRDYGVSKKRPNTSDITEDKNIHYQNDISDAKGTDRSWIQRKRDVILIGSTLSFFPIPGFSAYSPTKTALYDFFKTARHELKKLQVDLYFYILSTTKTPGYKQENITKPEITKRLENFTEEENVDIRTHDLLNSMKYYKTIPSDSTVWILRSLPEIFIIEARDIIYSILSYFYD